MSKSLLSTPYTFPGEDPDRRKKPDPARQLAFELPDATSYQFKTTVTIGEILPRMVVLAMTGEDKVQDMGLFLLQGVARRNGLQFVLDGGERETGKRELRRFPGIYAKGEEVNISVDVEFHEADYSVIARVGDSPVLRMEIPLERVAHVRTPYQLISGMLREYLGPGWDGRSRGDWGPCYHWTIHTLEAETQGGQAQKPEPEPPPGPGDEGDPGNDWAPCHALLEGLDQEIARHLRKYLRERGDDNTEVRVFLDEWIKVKALAWSWEL